MIFRKPDHCELAVAHIPQFRATCECMYGGSGGTREYARHRRAEIARQLGPLKPDLLFLERLAEAEVAIREDDVFPVALLPARCSDTDWWELWGVLALLNSRPAILVYAREATFLRWSGILELGGYDVIVDPFSDKTLQGAVSGAAKSFEERRPKGSQPE